MSRLILTLVFVFLSAFAQGQTNSSLAPLARTACAEELVSIHYQNEPFAAVIASLDTVGASRLSQTLADPGLIVKQKFVPAGSTLKATKITWKLARFSKRIQINIRWGNDKSAEAFRHDVWRVATVAFQVHLARVFYPWTKRFWRDQTPGTSAFRLGPQQDTEVWLQAAAQVQREVVALYDALVPQMATPPDVEAFDRSARISLVRLAGFALLNLPLATLWMPPLYTEATLDAYRPNLKDFDFVRKEAVSDYHEQLPSQLRQRYQKRAMLQWVQRRYIYGLLGYSLLTVASTIHHFPSIDEMNERAAAAMVKVEKIMQDPAKINRDMNASFQKHLIEEVTLSYKNLKAEEATATAEQRPLVERKLKNFFRVYPWAQECLTQGTDCMELIKVKP